MNTIIDFGGSQKYRGEASYEVNYKDDYSTNIDIYVFDNTGGLTHTVTLFDAFPNSLNDINLDWGNQNSAMKITVGFTFRDWSLAPASGNILGLNMGTFNPAFFYPNAAIYAVDNLLSQVF